MVHYGSLFPVVYFLGACRYMPTFMDHPAVPAATRSAMWLGVMAAGMPNQLVFLLESRTFSSSVASPDGGWLQTIEASKWAAHVRALMPSVLPTFGSVPAATASVVEATALTPSAEAPPGLVGPLIRAALWPEPCPTTCAHVVVVNFHQRSFVLFSIQLQGLNAGTLPDNATRLFDASYNVTVGADGTLTDYIGPGDTSVYEV
jgi:hypothetical protein